MLVPCHHKGGHECSWPACPLDCQGRHPGEHQWFTYGRLNWECCRVCGIVRRKDGKNSPCKGPVAVGPR